MDLNNYFLKKRLSRQMITNFRLIEYKNETAVDLTKQIQKLSKAFPRIECISTAKINMQMIKELAKIETLRELVFTKPAIYANALKQLPPKLEVIFFFFQHF